MTISSAGCDVLRFVGLDVAEASVLVTSLEDGKEFGEELAEKARDSAIRWAALRRASWEQAYQYVLD